jgi:hypothetical protein
LEKLSLVLIVFWGLMKIFYVLAKSNRRNNTLSGLLLTLSLMSCNSVPNPLQIPSPYEKGTSVWNSSFSASGVSSLSSGFLSDQQWEKATNGWGQVDQRFGRRSRWSTNQFIRR